MKLPTSDFLNIAAAMLGRPDITLTTPSIYNQMQDVAQHKSIPPKKKGKRRGSTFAQRKRNARRSEHTAYLRHCLKGYENLLPLHEANARDKGMEPHVRQAARVVYRDYVKRIKSIKAELSNIRSKRHD